MNKKLILIAALLLITFSCTKEPNNVEPPISWTGEVLILNQGNFTEHSSSISLYDEVSGEVQNGVFESANGISIGATIISGRVSPFNDIYLVCNLPDKVEVIGSRDFKIKGEAITQELANPRDVAVGLERVYVSNWSYDYEENSSGWWIYPYSYVSVYNSATNEFIKKIEVGTDAEGVCLSVGNELFVATAEGVKVLDTQDDLLTTKTVISVDGWGAAKHIVIDNQGWGWASFPAKGVVKFNVVTHEVVKTIEVPIDEMNGYIEPSKSGDKIYTYNTTFDLEYNPEESVIYSVSDSDNSVSVFAQGNYFYGVGVSPITNNILAAEVSFTSNSLIKQYNSSGTALPFIDRSGNSNEGAAVGIGAFRFLFIPNVR